MNVTPLASAVLPGVELFVTAPVASGMTVAPVLDKLSNLVKGGVL